MTGVTLPLAVLAGVVSFASPCFLPIVPVFVGYLVGSSAPGSAGARRGSLAQAGAFVLGFTAVFVALWASIGLVGYALGDYRDALRIAGGAVLIVMGLHVAGVIELSLLYRQARLPVPLPAGAPGAPVPNRSAVGATTLTATPTSTTAPATSPPSVGRSALLGVAFGAGWTPCIGPILGGVIGMASVSDSVGAGTLLLLAYSLGLGIPFLLVAVGATEVSRRLDWLRRHEAAVGLVSGALLALVGFAMITNVFGRLTGLAPAFGL